MSHLLLPYSMRKKIANVAEACATAREGKKRRGEGFVVSIVYKAPAVHVPVIEAIPSPHPSETDACTLKPVPKVTRKRVGLEDTTCPEEETQF